MGGNGIRVIDGAKYTYAGVTKGRARAGVDIVVTTRLGREAEKMEMRE